MLDACVCSFLWYQPVLVGDLDLDTLQLRYVAFGLTSKLEVAWESPCSPTVKCNCFTSVQ